MFERFKIRRIENELRLAELSIVKEMVGTQRLKKTLKDTDENQWKLIGEDEKELGEAEQGDLRDQAIKLYYMNPHARNIIRLLEKYIVGRGFDINPKALVPEVKRWWKTFWRVNKMARRKKEIVRRTFRDGECFLRFFIDKVGMTIIRFMNPAKVKDPKDAKKMKNKTSHGIECSKNDIEEVLAYWYDEERIEAENIYHIKILVDSDVKRGRSFLEPMIIYLAMFKKWLEDRMKLNMVRAVVGLIKKVTGTPAQTANISSAHDTTKRTAPDGSPYHRAPDGVSVFTTNKGVDYEFKTPNLQASDVQHDGRNILLTIAAGAGMPEYMITSDASNANFASTMISEAPGIKEFQDWQDLFEVVFQDIFAKVIKAGIDKGEIPETQEVLQTMIVYDEEGKATEKAIMVKEETSTECDVVFPELVHRDIDKETKAYAMQSQQGWISDRTASARLDLDYEEEQEKIKQETEERGEEETADEEYEREREKELQTAPPEEKKEPKAE